MSERELEKHKVLQAFKTMRGAELTQVINSYFKKFLAPDAEKSLPIGSIFDGKIPESLEQVLR